MLDGISLEIRITGLIHNVLAERSIERTVSTDDDLRDIGLTSLDMVSLVLLVEAEFDVRIPENKITPANFRSVRAMSALVAELVR
jgi:acyl carrier protein